MAAKSVASKGPAWCLFTGRCWFIWWFPDMGVPPNKQTITNHFWGTPMTMAPPILVPHPCTMEAQPFWQVRASGGWSESCFIKDFRATNSDGSVGGSKKFGNPNSWMVYVMENPIYKWMITGCSPILGNPHVPLVPLVFFVLNTDDLVRIQWHTVTYRQYTKRIRMDTVWIKY